MKPNLIPMGWVLLLIYSNFSVWKPQKKRREKTSKKAIWAVDNIILGGACCKLQKLSINDQRDLIQQYFMCWVFQLTWFIQVLFVAFKPNDDIDIYMVCCFNCSSIWVFPNYIIICVCLYVGCIYINIYMGQLVYNYNEKIVGTKNQAWTVWETFSSWKETRKRWGERALRTVESLEWCGTKFKCAVKR